MATDHRGKNKHQRTGRVPPHGTGERVIDETTATDRELPEAARRAQPETVYKREQADDVPGVRKKIR
jgi:hypothetical protein